MSDYLKAVIEHYKLPSDRVFPGMPTTMGMLQLQINPTTQDHAAIAAIMQRYQQQGNYEVPQPEPLVLAPYVWLYRNMLTEDQRIAPFGIDPSKNQYAVAIDSLTEEQHAIPYVADQLRDAGVVVMMVDEPVETNDIVHAAHATQKINT